MTTEGSGYYGPTIVGYRHPVMIGVREAADQTLVGRGDVGAEPIRCQPFIVIRTASVEEFIAFGQERGVALSMAEVKQFGLTHFYEVATD